jgi:tRNA A-37 threonylcarbamoyl transferase component Bud32
LGPLLGRRWLGLARPRRELRVTTALHAAGAPVPRPALALGLAVGWPFWHAALATERVEGAADALAFLDAGPARAQLERACAAAGHAVRRFHDCGGVHPDLHVKNLLVRETGSATDVVVIDLDRAEVRAGVAPEERMRELMRLLRSLHKRGRVGAVGRRGVARFFAAYVSGDRALRRALLAHRAVEERRIARHAWLWPAPPRAPQS